MADIYIYRSEEEREYLLVATVTLAGCCCALVY